MKIKASMRVAVYRLIFFLTLAHNVQSQQIDPLSVTSLNLKILHNDVAIGTATGFVVAKNSHYYLVTNRHVVLACALDTDQTNLGGWICANRLSIFHNKHGHLGEWLWVIEDLLDEHQKKRWFEHPQLAGAADLVALPLSHTESAQLYPLDIALRSPRAGRYRKYCWLSFWTGARCRPRHLENRHRG